MRPVTMKLSTKQHRRVVWSRIRPISQILKPEVAVVHHVGKTY